MNSNQPRTSGIPLACLTLLLLASGCASQKTLKQYQDEVRALREERTQLKKENRDLRAQTESYETTLAQDASAPAPARVSDNPELDAVGVDYGIRDGNFFMSIPAEVNFAKGKADLSKKGKEALQAVARVLLGEHAAGKYWIEGHTDTDPIKKSGWESNRDLSVARGMAVLHFLVEECNVPDEQCVVAGHGQYEPLASNSDEGGKARNRRVEIVVHRDGTMPGK